jgi:hypothetical protein
MITKHDIIKMVKRVHRESQGLPPRRLIYPTREWAIGVLATCVLVVVACAGSAYGYIYLSEIGTRIELVEPTIARYQAAAVERTIELYKLRADRFADLGDQARVFLPAVIDESTSFATSSSIEVFPSTTTTETAVINPELEEAGNDVGDQAAVPLRAI